MINGLLTCLILAMAVASMSCTISKAGVMRPIRQWVREKNDWVGKLISCAYCTSHWISFVLVVIYRPTLLRVVYFVDLMVSTFVVVTMTAILVYWIEWSVGFNPDPQLKQD